MLHLNRSEWHRHCQVRVMVVITSRPLCHPLLSGNARGREVKCPLSIYSHQPALNVQKTWRRVCLFSVVIPYLRGEKVSLVHGYDYGNSWGKRVHFFFLWNPLKARRPYSMCSLTVMPFLFLLVIAVHVDIALPGISAFQKELTPVIRLHETFAIKCQIKAAYTTAFCVLHHRVHLKLAFGEGPSFGSLF